MLQYASMENVIIMNATIEIEGVGRTRDDFLNESSLFDTLIELHGACFFNVFVGKF